MNQMNQMNPMNPLNQIRRTPMPVGNQFAQPLYPMMANPMVMQQLVQQNILQENEVQRLNRSFEYHLNKQKEAEKYKVVNDKNNISSK